jgi:hypothetical protein
MQNTGLTRNLMHSGMNKHGRGFNRMMAGERCALRIHHHNIIGLNFTPQQTTRIQQKAAALIGNLDAKVIADAFGQAMKSCRAQR